jgi:hypothetical protein
VCAALAGIFVPGDWVLLCATIEPVVGGPVVRSDWVLLCVAFRACYMQRLGTVVRSNWVLLCVSIGSCFTHQFGPVVRREVATCTAEQISDLRRMSS